MTRLGKKILKGVYTAKEAADILGIKKSWLYMLLDEGRLREVSTREGKVRLVDGESLKQYAMQRKCEKIVSETT